MPGGLSDPEHWEWFICTCSLLLSCRDQQGPVVGGVLCSTGKCERSPNIICRPSPLTAGGKLIIGETLLGTCEVYT